VLGYQGEEEPVARSSENEPVSVVDQISRESHTATASTNSNALPQPTRNATGGAGNNASDNESLNRDLLRRIQAAAQDVDSEPASAKPQALKVTDLNDLPRIDQLSPALLTQMPAMSFSAHMYASNPRDRWVRVNSQRLGEGDVIANNVVLKRIESEKVVLEYKGQEFTMNALSDW
jgi:general secretion pathway protein B